MARKSWSSQRGDEAFPVRGTPGGWRDAWDDEREDPTVVRARLARFDAAVQRTGAAWRAEISDEASTATRRARARPGA